MARQSWQARETTPLVAINEDLVQQRANEASSAESESGPSIGGILFGLCLMLCIIGGGSALLFNVFGENNGRIPIQSDSQIPFVTAAHKLRPTNLWGSLSGPYPTGAWFTNLVIGDGDMPIAPLPYAVKVTSAGVGVSYSAARRRVMSKHIQDVYDGDILVATGEPYIKHYLSRYDNLTATVRHELRGGASYSTYLVRGSPYMTFDFADCTPTIGSNAGIMTINGEAVSSGYSIRGTTLKLGLGNWQTWMVYISESVTFKMEGTVLKATVPISGIIRIALLPSQVAQTTLDLHAYAYAKGGQMTFEVTRDSLLTRVVWDKAGFGDILMLALPHHIDQMDLQVITTALPLAYQTTKGKMTGIVGSSWELRDTLTTTTWRAGQGSYGSGAGGGGATDFDWSTADFSKILQLKKALYEDLGKELPTAPDVYNFGKQCARMARLALIADELGEVTYVEQAVSLLEETMSPWLRNDNRDLLVYDRTWGGIVTYDGLNDVHADFGNAWFNDHHFHYGYFLYAVAVVCKFHPGFYDTFKKQLDFLAADIAGTDEDSTYFPLARHKDLYDGHSWASGLFPQANGKSQESSSEAVNGYYAVYLLGLATHNTRLKDWGRVLLASELRSVHRYWQMKEGDDIYDSLFAANRMVGVVAALEVIDMTWFGDKVEWVHGINMMPFTPISEELLPYDFMEQEWPVLATAFDRKDDPPQDTWSGYLYLAKGIVDADSAWEDVQSLTVFDTANSLSNSLYWLITRPKQIPYNVTEFSYPITIEPECASNSACFAQGLTQEGSLCCPSELGDWLGCCPSYSDAQTTVSQCAANPKCLEQGLKADDLCCPDITGLYLDCCETSHPLHESAAACENNPGCESLQGDCCPTTAGMYLGCCGSASSSSASGSTNSTSTTQPDSGGGTNTTTSTSATPTSGASSAACSATPACSALTGDCCPTSDGIMLGCC